MKKMIQIKSEYTDHESCVFGDYDELIKFILELKQKVDKKDKILEIYLDLDITKATFVEREETDKEYQKRLKLEAATKKKEIEQLKELMTKYPEVVK